MTDIRKLMKKQCTDEEFKQAQGAFWESIRRQTGLTDEQLLASTPPRTIPTNASANSAVSGGL